MEIETYEVEENVDKAMAPAIEALKSFPVLVKEARALLQEDYERRIEATAQLCKTSLATIKSLVEDGLNGRWVHIPQ